MDFPSVEADVDMKKVKKLFGVLYALNCVIIPIADEILGHAVDDIECFASEYGNKAFYRVMDVLGNEIYILVKIHHDTVELKIFKNEIKKIELDKKRLIKELKEILE